MWHADKTKGQHIISRSMIIAIALLACISNNVFARILVIPDTKYEILGMTNDGNWLIYRTELELYAYGSNETLMSDNLSTYRKIKLCEFDSNLENKDMPFSISPSTRKIIYSKHVFMSHDPLSSCTSNNFIHTGNLDISAYPKRYYIAWSPSEHLLSYTALDDPSSSHPNSPFPKVRNSVFKRWSRKNGHSLKCFSVD